MNLNNNQVATLLLTTHLALNDMEIRPYTTIEWNKLVTRIINSSIKTPGRLLEVDKGTVIKELMISEDEGKRIYTLLGRGALLAIELERLESKGIGIITRGSEEYPKKINKKLGRLAPAVLFFVGNLDLINNKAISIVGSRNVNETMLQNTKAIVHNAIKDGYVICSGGARGIDSISEVEAYNCDGAYISFLSDSLEAKIKKKEVREALSSGRALLITSYKPDAPFSVGNAMNRNKYVYAQADKVFIINSDFNKGGTWAGAIENLKNNWTPSFVIDSKNKGNQGLIEKGCTPITIDTTFSIDKIIEVNKNTCSDEIEVLDFFSKL